ncbi:hypothetical protein [Paenibacillus tengchongensis]|uniref:hypothetical protein n=1 Tax=Paenibacillus tengchongensis TaxID=2608684 RepID=UPI00124D7131|nr:hypothetical protein [Paenibacillus tengchongensis]
MESLVRTFLFMKMILFLSVHYRPYLRSVVVFWFLIQLQKGMLEMKFLKTLQDDPSKVKLRPSGVTALLVAPTASGKTTVTAQFATYGAARLLNLTIGEGSSTIVDRQLVYTSALEHHMIVSVKPKTPYVPLPEFIARITSRLVDKLATYQRKLRMIDVSEIESEVEDDLERAFNNTMNTQAEYSLLPVEDRLQVVRELTGPIAGFLKSKGLEIFNHAANSLDVDEAPKNSMKLRDAIKTKLHSFIQSDLQIQQVIDKVYTRLNESLDHYFHSFFDKENKSADDYYFKIIDVNTPSTHKEFILAFFSNNNIQKGSKLSLEVLCDEIVIHLPMKETIVEAIQEDKVRRQTRSVYEDFNQNSISLTLVDTQGLFHLASDEQMEQDRLRHMLYSTRYDALICLTPMHGNPNGTKFEIQMSQEMAKYKKNVPVFFLCNKVDEYADKLQKDNSTASNALDDLFNDDKPETNQIDILKSVISRAEEQTKSITLALKDRKQGNVCVLPVMFKDPVNQLDRDSLDPHFGALAVVNNIVQKIADNLAQAASFIKFTYHSNVGWSQRPFEVNTKMLVQCLRDTWSKAETNNQVKRPALENIEHNQGRNPHGNGFNALVIRLKRGEGWDSNILEGYFKNHHSFHVRFPANLSNIISAELIAQLANAAVEYNGEIDGKDKFISHIIEFFKEAQLQFVADILYHQIFANLLSTYYSNYNVFQGFLNQSEPLFQLTPEQFSVYAESYDGQQLPNGTEYVHKLVTALQRQMENALSLVFNRFVYVE